MSLIRSAALVEDHLEISEMYPHSSDDESRTILYLETGSGLSLVHSHAFIGDVEALPDHVRRPLKSVLLCRIPAWKNPAGILTKLEENFRLVFTSKTFDEWQALLPRHLFQKDDVPDSRLVTHFFRGFAFSDYLGSVLSNANRFLTPLDYTPCYDSFLMSTWHDELQERNIDIEFRPRWVVRPQKSQDSLTYGHVPDVVMSARVSSDFEGELKAFHPAHDVVTYPESLSS